MHRNLDGELIAPQIAAVELLNVIRPIVAVAVFLTFAVLAMHDYGECRERLQKDPDGYPYLFAQEVRRLYPFFPVVGAETRHEFEWNGYRFPGGMPVLLDLYGTNHDERSWDSPDLFLPERFRTWDGSPFNFVPQGGGDRLVNHRCPGEPISIELLKATAGIFARRVRYEVPSQDLEINFRRVPALPRSKCQIRNVVLV
jgi:fatty-acid peroxygenase